MVSRFFIICPGCSETMMVRLAIGPMGETRFYVPCPYCGLPSRGRMTGHDLESLKVEFDAVQTAERDDVRSIMVDPDIPCLPTAKSVGEIGGGPNMNLLFMTGDNVESVMTFIGATRAIAGDNWREVSHFLEYYLEGQWDHFTAKGQAIFGAEWPVPTTAHERHSRAHDALLFSFGPLQVDDVARDATFEFQRDFIQALRTPGFVSFLRDQEDLRVLRADMRRLFDVCDLVFRSAGSWISGIVWWLIPDDRREAIADYQVFRDEFTITRDIYQQGFEACCKTIRYVVATRNVALRGDVGDFGPRPPEITWRWPTSLETFDKLPNAWKIRVLADASPWRRWADVVLDREMRNAIGHNSTRHDLRSGDLVNDSGTRIPYFDFLGAVYRMTTGLLTMTHVMRSMRIGSSRDFAT